MLRDTNSKLELADIEDTNTCPECNPDTDIGIAHSTRESQARGGIDSESCDREAQSSHREYTRALLLALLLNIGVSSGYSQANRITLRAVPWSTSHHGHGGTGS